MGIILSKSKKLFVVMILTILISNIILPVFAANYTSNLKVGNKLKFTGNSWYVYTSKSAAQDLDKTKTTTSLKKNDTITIQEISGNVLKISSGKYIYYGSNASSNFTKISSSGSNNKNTSSSSGSNNSSQKNKTNTPSSANGFNIFSLIEPVINIVVSLFDLIFSSTPKDIEIPKVEIPEIKVPEIETPNIKLPDINNAFDGLTDIITGITSNLDNNNIFEPIKSSTEENKEATSISLPIFTTEIKVGQTKTLNLTYSPSSATKPNVTFNSGNENIVIVNKNNGKIEGIKPGETNIIAQTDTGLQASCKIRVLPTEATSINIEHSEYTLYKGNSYTLKYTVQPSGMSKSDLTWTSNNECVSVINGKITAKKVTSSPVTITVKTKNGLKDTCKVTVIDSPSSTGQTFRFTYYTKEECGHSSTGSGKNENNFGIDPTLGCYTYNGKVVLAAATNLLLNNSNWKKRSHVHYFDYYDEVNFTYNGKTYTGIILDSCGVSMAPENYYTGSKAKTNVLDMFFPTNSSANKSKINQKFLNVSY